MRDDEDQAGEYDVVHSLLKAALGSQVRLVECQKVNHGPGYWVFLAQLRHPDMDVVIKLAGPEAQMAGQFDRTAAIHRLVAQYTSIPMPETIAVDVTCQAWPWRYMIREAQPGVEWAFVRNEMDAVELAGAYRQIGEAAAQLHQIGFPAFGMIDALGQVDSPDLSCPSALRQHASRIIKNLRLQDVFLAVLEQRLSWFEPIQQAGLCHEDLHGYNILFEKQSGKWKLSAILDFDKAWAGHTESDLARLDFWRGMTSPDFWVAYQAIAGRALQDGYLYRRAVYQLLWCLEYARATPEHVADTWQVCQELNIPKIERFD